VKAPRRKIVAAESKTRKGGKRPDSRPKYSAEATKRPVPDAATRFDVLHAAHRARMGSAVAAVAAGRLRTVAQVMGLAFDASKRRGEVPPAVATAFMAADSLLQEQIAGLDRVAGEAPRGPIQVADVLGDVVTLARQHADPRLKITLDVARNLPAATGSALDLAEIVFELLHNSARALASGGERIHVSTAQSTDQVRIVVQDDGPGVATEIRRGLFEPLRRTKDGTQLGIGLAVSRMLAERNGGTLEYEPRGERGARFVLTFPRWTSPRTGAHSSAA